MRKLPMRTFTLEELLSSKENRAYLEREKSLEKNAYAYGIIRAGRNARTTEICQLRGALGDQNRIKQKINQLPDFVQKRLIQEEYSALDYSILIEQIEGMKAECAAGGLDFNEYLTAYMTEDNISEHVPIFEEFDCLRRILIMTMSEKIDDDELKAHFVSKLIN